MTAHLQRGASALVGRERRLHGFVVLILAGVLAACASSDVKELLTPSAAASSTKGYLYGRFNLDSDGGMGLWIRLENVDNKHTFKMAFQDIGAPPYAAEIEPGTYRIKEFARGRNRLNMATEMDLHNVAIPPQLSFISRPVSVQAGKGYYLGDFIASSKQTGVVVTPLVVVVKSQTGILEYRRNFDATSKWLKERYPSLANVDLQPAFGKSE